MQTIHHPGRASFEQALSLTFLTTVNPNLRHTGNRGEIVFVPKR